MATALYDLTIPVFIRNLESLSKILAKGEAFAAEKGIDPSELTKASLIVDMGALVSQVQRATDSAKGLPTRFGFAALAIPDDEATFAELQRRIATTVAFLKTVPRDAIDGKEAATVTLTTPNKTFEFTGLDFVLGFALPNFFFHVTTAYAILRMKGVQIGKMDYLGRA